ncbi:MULTISPECIES: FAD-binding oxidoreductase [Frankia]|uniref:Secreted FAD-linked oxidase n=1 Tax=Frankia alni (strain DSM 45986 / CECT 9034 / ACN14a) TaxID=326424 RepID=Q0RGV8_FRAAA|nr:putative secreted FAD-linked oxidase [Frankia alni ACN14a]
MGSGALSLVDAGTARAASTAPAAPTSTSHGFGPVTIKSDDQRYGALITGDNQRWVGSPDYIQLVGSTQQVVDAVQTAVRNGLQLSVRSGGHCYEDFVANSAVRVVIDMSAMNAVYYDSAMKAFAVEAGARLLNVYEALYRGWGVTIPGGRCYSVGAGGHICGGGDGPLSRRFGIVVDHLYAIEIVVVDKSGTARSVVATREDNDPNRDLWWAHTGCGGGNYGIVTRYWMRSPAAKSDDPGSLLPKPPATMLMNGLSFSWSDLDQNKLSRLLQNFGGWHERNSAPDSPGVAVVSSLALNHKSNGSVSIFTLVEGSIPSPEKVLTDFINEIRNGVAAETGPMIRPTGELGPMPEIVKAQHLPWLQSVRYLATNSPVLTNPTLRADHKSAYLRKSFTAAETATIYKYLTSDSTNPNSMLLLLPFGGNINATQPSATAFPHRSSVMQALYQSFWSDPADDAKNLAWVRGFYSDVYAATGGVPVPNDRTDGCYINYADTDLSDPAYNSSKVPWHDLYYKENYPKLQQVKARWDPKNVFRHSQSIELPG